MKIFNNTSRISRGRETRTLSDNFRLFSSQQIPAYTRGTSKGSLRYKRENAATAKDAEVCSLCHFAGQNRSGRKKRFRKKSALPETRTAQSSEWNLIPAHRHSSLMEWNARERESWPMEIEIIIGFLFVSQIVTQKLIRHKLKEYLFHD